MTMNERQARLLLAAISAGLLVWLLMRRRAGLLQELPGIVEERIVLPMGGFMREGLGAGAAGEQPFEERMTRKVGRNRKISVGGKLYGPLDPELVGQQVEVEEQQGRLVVFSGPDEIGSFERQD